MASCTPEAQSVCNLCTGWIGPGLTPNPEELLLLLVVVSIWIIYSSCSLCDLPPSFVSSQGDSLSEITEVLLLWRLDFLVCSRDDCNSGYLKSSRTSVVEAPSSALINYGFYYVNIMAVIVDFTIIVNYCFICKQNKSKKR